jgi:hypothetical protein
MTNKDTIQARTKLINTYKVCVGCCICGYNKNPSALCFDHIDKENKHQDVKNGYSRRSSAGGMFRLYGKKYDAQEIITEIQKCRVVCSNCHMEHTHKKPKFICKNIRTLIDLEKELTKTNDVR